MDDGLIVYASSVPVVSILISSSQIPIQHSGCDTSETETQKSKNIQVIIIWLLSSDLFFLSFHFIMFIIQVYQVYCAAPDFYDQKFDFINIFEQVKVYNSMNLHCIIDILLRIHCIILASHFTHDDLYFSISS